MIAVIVFSAFADLKGMFLIEAKISWGQKTGVLSDAAKRHRLPIRLYFRFVQ